MSLSGLSLLRRKIRLSHVLLALFLFVFITSFPATPAPREDPDGAAAWDEYDERSSSGTLQAASRAAQRGVFRLKDKFKTVTQDGEVRRGTACDTARRGEGERKEQKAKRAMGTPAARRVRRESAAASSSPKIEARTHTKRAERATLRSRQLDPNVPQRPLGFPAPPNYCTPLEYSQGFWQQRPEGPFTSLDELRDAFSVDASSTTMGCHPIEWPIEEQGDPSLDEPEHVRRMLETSSWRYVPGAANDATKGVGCDRKELVRDDFVKMLLRSRTGLVLVGDSLTEQHYNTVRNILIRADGPFYVEGWGDRPRYEGIKMHRDHPEAQRLLELAGVDAARTDYPIVSLYLERHLLTRNEMDDVFHDVESYKSFRSGQGMEQWIAESIWWEHYEKIMRNHRVQFTPGSDAREEPGILVLNTGPHWIEYEFSTADALVTDDEILRAWRRMLVRINTKIRDFSEAEHAVFWRSTAPGHPHCELSLSGAENRTDFRSTHDPSYKRYNWETFEIFNREVRDFVRYDEHASLPARHPPGKRIQYLDIWPLAVQRPDAHLLPPNDCLHFCYQGVMEEWTKMLWHLVAAQAHNPDYRGKEKVYKM